MLEGINVLNKIAETDAPSWCIWMLFGIFGVITLIGIIYSIINFEEKDDKIAGSMLCALIGIIISGVITMTLSILCEEPTGEYTYQVTIDRSVDFKEFDSKYYVTKQEGAIYYIREK